MSYKSSLTGAELDDAGARIKDWTEKGLTAVFNKMASLKMPGTSSTLKIKALFDMMLNTEMHTTYPALLTQANSAMPYYAKGMAFVYGAGWSGDADKFMPNVTLSSSSSGDQLAMFSRFRYSLPSALIIPVQLRNGTTPITAVPFFLVSFNGLNKAVYRSASDLNSGAFPQIQVTLNMTDLTSITSIALDNSNYSPKSLEVAPIKNPLFSISNQGALNTSRITVSETSTDDAQRVYEALAAGYPPAMGVKMTCDDGKDSMVWLYPTRTSTAIIYESSSLSGSPASGKKLRISITRSTTGSYAMQATLIADSTT